MLHRCEKTQPHIRLRGLHNSLTYQKGRGIVSVDLGIWNRAHRRSEDLGQQVARPREARGRSGHDIGLTLGDQIVLGDGRSGSCMGLLILVVVFNTKYPDK